MSNPIITYTEDLNQRGRKIYEEKKCFRTIANLMEHPEFRQFFDTYMGEWETAQTMIMFMKIYEAIEKRSNVVLTPHEKLAVVHDVIEDPKLRQQVCNGMTDWIKQTSEHSNQLEE